MGSQMKTFSLEDCTTQEDVANVILSKVHSLFDQKDLYVEFWLNYSDLVSNTQVAPANHTLNWKSCFAAGRRMMDTLPIGYPGWRGTLIVGAQTKTQYLLSRYFGSPEFPVYLVNKNKELVDYYEEWEMLFFKADVPQLELGHALENKPLSNFGMRYDEENAKKISYYEDQSTTGSDLPF